MDKIRLFALGGLDEVGKDLYCIEINNDIFVIECGIKIPDKTMPGIDFIMPQIDYLIENKDRIRAYIITHGHDPEIGALPYIYSLCPAPLYCTKLTSIFVESFRKYCALDNVKIAYQIVNPTDERIIANRRFRFFSTTHNMPQSFGIAISTDQGNIIFIDDFVNDYNSDPGFTYDARSLMKIGEEKTLLLMTESLYADRIGYTSPFYKAVPKLDYTIKEAKGRIIYAIPTDDIYNLAMLAKASLKYGRRLFSYDDETLNLYQTLASSSPNFVLSDKMVGHRDDVNRYKESDVAIFMTGFGPKLFYKLELLASGKNDDRRIRLNKDDTIIIVNAFSYENEIAENDAINELTKVVDNVKYFRKNEFIKMHASEEDLKAAISMLEPKYYLPIRGTFKSLLANAQLALSMGLGLNHSNVFVLDNGMVLEVSENRAFISKDVVKHGDLFIDGKLFGHYDEKALEERKKMSDDGVILLGATISKSKKAIILGPDVQMRGFVYLKDAESILREVTRLFIATIKNEFKEEVFAVNRLYDNFIDLCQRQMRRETGKVPVILPYIAISE